MEAPIHSSCFIWPLGPWYLSELLTLPIGGRGRGILSGQLHKPFLSFHTEWPELLQGTTCVLQPWWMLICWSCRLHFASLTCRLRPAGVGDPCGWDTHRAFHTHATPPGLGLELGWEVVAKGTQRAENVPQQRQRLQLKVSPIQDWHHGDWPSLTHQSEASVFQRPLLCLQMRTVVCEAFTIREQAKAPPPSLSCLPSPGMDSTAPKSCS